MKKVGTLILSGILLAACQSGNCRSNRSESEKGSKKTDVPIASSPQNRTKVFKYDGTLQCGMGKAISISDMQKELTGIVVYSAENKNDGLMRIQVCGAPTGKANVFEIDKSSLDKAKENGFKEWTFN